MAILWGCDPARQFEQAWLQTLLLRSAESTVLVESGLLRLERQPSAERLRLLAAERRQRLAALREQPFTLIHLSDEEGRDGDALYPEMPPHCRIWRNFPHPRFAADPRIHTFPIGPRDCFLVSAQEMAGPASSSRQVPWAFMGTLWPSGSRTLAVSLFLRALPQGIFYGGRRFGVGVPLHQYRQHLFSSVFALAPEGDRHLDTFRLWESLCCGCIPLVVDHNSTAPALLGPNAPVPVFSTWPQALRFAQAMLEQPEALDRLQHNLQLWWQGLRQTLTSQMGDVPG